MAATRAATLARPALQPRPASERISLVMLDADSHAQRVYVAVTERILGVLRALGLYWQFVRRRRTDSGASRPLTTVAHDIVNLWNAGATEAELRRFEYFLRDIIDSCSCGRAVRTLAELDVEEQELEGLETTMQTRRQAKQIAGEPVTPDELETEARLLEREAFVGLEKARVLRREARRPTAFAPRVLPFPAVGAPVS